MILDFLIMFLLVFNTFLILVDDNVFFILIFNYVKSLYYTILIYTFIIILLGNMGYGWSILGVIMNLDVFKRAGKDANNNNSKNNKKAGNTKNR